MPILDDKIRKEYNNAYYKKNRDKRLERAKAKVKCPICDCEITKSVLSRHRKTEKHIKNVKLAALEEKLGESQVSPPKPTTEPELSI